MSIWVVNTSPLVFLGNLSRLELLRREGHEVYIPRAVAEEISEKPDAAAQAVQAACAIWIQVRNVTDETAVTLNNLERRQAVSTERAGTKSWIRKTPGVCGGEPCVRNTRHTVAGLVEWKKQGLTDARILEHHPDLTLADLEAAWAYYATHREQIEQAIKEAAEA
jgi:uncharacterized protein (DUF433 family)